MKTKTTHCITLLVLLALVLLPIISAASMPVERPIQVMNKSSTAVESTDLNTEKILFDFQNFDNNTVFDATKTVSVNEWGYTIVNTTVSVHNNGSSVFNYFNITFPIDEWEQYDRSVLYPSEIAVDTPVMDSSNSTVTLAFQTPDIEVNSSYTFSIISGSGVISRTRSGVPQTDTTYPYRIETHLLPRLSIPLNSLVITVECTSGGTVTFDEENLIFGENITAINPQLLEEGTGYQLTLNSLDTVDTNELGGSGPGEYNLTLLDEVGVNTFIPGYTAAIKDNMTSIILTDYRENDARAYMTYTSVDSTIDIDQWEKTVYTDVITVKNIGAEGTVINGYSAQAELTSTKQSSVYFFIPYDAVLDSIHDKHGNLTATTAKMEGLDGVYEGNITRITADIRTALPANGSATITIKYHVKNTDGIDDRGGGKFVLESPLMSLCNWTISNYKLTVMFPSSANFELPEDEFLSGKCTRGSARELLIFSKPVLSFESDLLTPLDNNKIEFTYGLPIYWFIINPLFMTAFFLIIGVIYTAARIISFQISPSLSMRIEEEIPYDLIESFVKAYEEKTALRERVRQLMERKKKTRAKEYEKSLKIYNNKQIDVDRQLVHSTTELSKIGTRYRDACRNIQLAESEREDVIKNLESLEKRKKASRIDRETYIRLQRQYEKRLKRSNSTIDKVLIELRSLLTEKK